MRRAARIGIGAGVAAGAGAGILGLRRRLADRRAARQARADEARRAMWPPVPVKPGAELHIEADRADRAEPTG